MNNPVGQSVERADGPLKLSGQAEFTGDIKLPGMLYAAIVHSPVAHARIRSVDTAAAERADGVVAVLTSDDLADIDPYYGHALRDRPVVALGKVRFTGEPVAVVAAVTQAAAEAAVALIDAEYEELPIAASTATALAPDAPLVHEKRARPGAAHGLGDLPDADGNICYSYSFRRGDTKRSFEQAAVVVEGEYTFPAVYQYSMETHTTIAHWQGGELTLWSSCQHPFLVRQEIAVLFGLPLDRVRIIVPFLGGGFGSKSYTKMEPLTAAIARKAGRPVRILNAVHESMITTRRHNMTARMRTAAAADGTLLGRECQAWLDTGAYADNGPRVTATAGDAAPGPYRWQALDVTAHCVYTNTSPSGSYRAFGATHLQWIAESQLDEVARRLGIDRLDIRRQNLLRPGEEVRPGGKPLDADLIGDVEKAAAAIGWPPPSAPPPAPDPAWSVAHRPPSNVVCGPHTPGGLHPASSAAPTRPTTRRGRGVSVGLLAAGAHPVSTATVRMGPDGSVTVLVGTTEMGQGARTVMAQIAAGVLHAPVDQVVMRGTDTRFTPYDRSTGASRSTTVAGLAVQRAAQEVMNALLETAAAKLETPPQLLEPVEGGIKDPGGRTLTHAELVRARFGFDGGELLGQGRVQPEGGSGSYAEGPVFWEVCVAGAEVEVDLETGVVTVLRTSTVADVGKAINPQLVARQDEGATLQGLGNAMFEEMHFAPDGPESVGQASRLLADLGDEGAAYCGGTELLLAMKLGLASYEHLVDLKRVGALRGISVLPSDGIRIGAAATHRELETSPVLRARYPELCAMISQVANVRVRSVGTLGGNLCFADPHSDPASFLMAAGATMLCQHGGTTRRVLAAAFLAGLYETALAPGELLTAVELPARPDRTALSHLRMKLTERPAVTVTAMLTLAPAEVASSAVAGARLVVGSVGSVPHVADVSAVTNAAGDFAAAAEACAEQAAASCAPSPGGEASAEYLRHLVFIHARQALWDAFTRASQPR